MNDQVIASRLHEFFAGDGSRWTQGAWARDVDGDSLNDSDDACVCWCLQGAANRLGISGTDAWWSFGERHFGSIMLWNDAPKRTFADVENKLREIAGVST